MNLACIHTHTSLGDGSDDVETCCLMAYKKGLTSLGFSDHAPITRKTGIRSTWHLPDEKLGVYIETVRAAKKRWEGKLPVYLGLEVDFISGIMGPADKDYRELELDFIIGSVHYVVPPRGEPFIVDYLEEIVDQGIKDRFGGDPIAMAEAYWNAEAAMISAGGFDVLAHPDLVKKNNAVPGGSGYRLFPEYGNFYREKTTAIASLMAKTGLPAEINTGGMNRGKTKDCYPSPGFLKTLREYRVPMIINSDAHRAEDLDGHYKEAIQALLDAGYTETVLFAGRENNRAIWKSIRF